MNELVQWLNDEAERLEKEQATSDDPYKTVNHSFIQGFYYALAHVELFNNKEETK